MNRLFIDSSAWIEYFFGSERGKKISEIIDIEETITFTTGLVIAEVCVACHKQGRSPEIIIQALKTIARLIPFDAELGMLTASEYVVRRKTNSKFGMADAHVLAGARIMGAKVLTCDNDFRGIPESIII
ncbi:MAG: PIN domain-containing protein [Candidatus Woesearchaeota archaeon]|nr:PIN domain-containing protein [Candidatus Woesearchaeota archaeon]